MEFISQTPKPSWKELFWRESATCPIWYADLQWESHRRFWTEKFGSGFYDWYLETAVEGAKELEPRPSQPAQLYLPGIQLELTSAESYLVDSY